MNADRTVAAEDQSSPTPSSPVVGYDNSADPGTARLFSLPLTIPPGQLPARATELSAQESAAVFLARARELAAGDRDRQWTYLYYIAEDYANNGGDILLDMFCADAYSAENLDVIVLDDPYEDVARLWYIPGGGNKVLLANWGEVNMADPITMQDFILVAKAYFPADRYLLAVCGHGGGWYGACPDDTNDDLVLTMDEFQQAITGGGGVDILAFTGPCLMGAVESVYELRDLVDVYVGSEELSTYSLWYGIVDDICSLLNNSQMLSNEQIGSMMVEYVEMNAATISNPDVQWFTMGAASTDRIDALAQSVDALASHLITQMAQVGPVLYEAREACWVIAGFYLDDFYQIDFISWLDEVDARTTDPTIEGLIEDVHTAFGLSIINNWTGPSSALCHGLAIYYPHHVESFSSLYGSVDLDFATDTCWNTFLQTYFDYLDAQTAVTPRYCSRLLGCLPNPFNPCTTVVFELARAQQVSVTVCDLAGYRIAVLSEGFRTAGIHRLKWDGTDFSGCDVASGTYLVCLQSEETVTTEKVMLVR